MGEQQVEEVDRREEIAERHSQEPVEALPANR